MMDIGSGSSWLLTDDDEVHDVKWLPDHDGTIAWLRSATNGFTQLVVVCIGNTGELKDHYTAAEFDAPVQHLKLKGLDGWIVFAVVGLAGKDGSLYNEETTGKMSTARIYDDLNVRGVCTSRTNKLVSSVTSPVNMETALVGHIHQAEEARHFLLSAGNRRRWQAHSRRPAAKCG